jgi:hypothetical protein
MMTDVQLAGNMDGVELAHIAKGCNPGIGVIARVRQAPPGFPRDRLPC